MANVPFHVQTALRNRREASFGPRDGSHDMTLPQAKSQMASTWAQPTAIASGHACAVHRELCQSGYSRTPVRITGTSGRELRSCTSPGRKTSKLIGISGRTRVRTPAVKFQSHPATYGSRAFQLIGTRHM